MKKLALTVVVFGFVFCSSLGNAQFEKGKNYLGPHLGISGIGSTFTIGGDYERGVTENVGVGALVDYWSYDFSYLAVSSGYSYKYITIGGTGSYHFMLDDKKWDPFVGLALGYYIVSIKTPAGGVSTGLDASRLFLGGQGGVRYFFSPNLAGQARVGFGAYILAVGVDFKF